MAETIGTQFSTIYNRFLEKITDALCEKETLLFSDIRMIRESSNIIAVNI